MERIEQLIICEVERFANAIEVIDNNGKLNREAFIKRFYEHRVGDLEWRKFVYEEYTGSYLAKAEAKQQQDGQQCSSTPMAKHQCI